MQKKNLIDFCFAFFCSITVETKLLQLRTEIPDGMTKLGLGLSRVNEQITRYGKKRASVVIVLTDGILEYTTKQRAVKEVDYFQNSFNAAHLKIINIQKKLNCLFCTSLFL